MTAQPVEDDVDTDHEAFLDAQGRLTLPDQVLAEANLAGGDKLAVEVVADGVLRLVRRRHPLLDLAGAFPGISAATDLEGLRDEWER
jgi:bifunctional DNA-binding transcriptional regulator/antitoxin component of YhaV-PrlF toxin-antitoxin module